jgi:electron transport complex protein RnfB
MQADVYEQLREQLDQYSIGFPSTESGVEIKLLKKMYNPEEADMFLQLTMIPDAPGNVAQRLGRDEKEVAELLERMAEKGLVFRYRKGDIAKYGAVPFVAGSYEFQLGHMDLELAELFEAYYQEGFHRSTAEAFMRPIPVNRSIQVRHAVATYEDVREIVKGQRLIALAKCICRVQQGLLDQACEKPVEACFVFGVHGQYYLDQGMARQVTPEEALEVLEECEKAGLVCQPYNSQNPGGMCNCCGDCCGILRSLNRMDKPAEVVATNYVVRLDADACVGCEICLDRCQMGALTMNDDGVAELNPDRCISCGLCVTTCEAEALTIELKDESERMAPPEKGLDQMLELAQRRGTTLTPLYMKTQ